ncbi:hypothetical protein PILCRDRAFT_34884, partial [Piloderma croceum F 1598]
MPLNYSKWDQLELSDDSDIEGHPNVDKKSLIRWKQRDIHEKREIRKQRIQALTAEISCNKILQPRLKSISDAISTNPTPLTYLSNLVDQLQINPSPDAPPTNAPDQPTYDAMVLSLLLQVSGSAKKAAAGKGDDVVGEKVKEGLVRHLVQLGEHTEQLGKDLETELKEQKKHITSEDMHDGFDSKYVPAPPEPEPIKHAKLDAKPKTKTTEFEVLNPKASTSAAAPAASANDDDDEEDDEDSFDTELPELTPSLEAFSHLPLWAYETSWKFIQSHRDVVVPGASDALLVAAFRAQGNGKEAYAKQCVHQSLLLQYCDKLGGDGVRVFFRKMVSADKRAQPVFVKDVEDTYTHLVTRVLASQTSEIPGGAEQIQLVPENPSQTISFNVPDGPPPENITLEGPGTEGMDVEEVRNALQMRWDVFDVFSKDLKEALRSGKLEGVNRCLGDMSVQEAEEVVRLLDVGGILSFAEGGIRDETGKGG